MDCGLVSPLVDFVIAKSQILDFRTPNIPSLAAVTWHTLFEHVEVVRKFRFDAARIIRLGQPGRRIAVFLW
jgi:hypothetical protein